MADNWIVVGACCPATSIHIGTVSEDDGHFTGPCYCPACRRKFTGGVFLHLRSSYGAKARLCYVPYPFVKKLPPDVYSTTDDDVIERPKETVDG